MKQHLLGCLGKGPLKDGCDPRMALGIVQLHLGAVEEGESLLIESLTDYFQLEGQQDRTPDLTQILLVGERREEYGKHTLVRTAMKELAKHLKVTRKEDALRRWTHVFESALQEHYWFDLAMLNFSTEEHDSVDHGFLARSPGR